MKTYGQLKANIVFDFYLDEICKFRNVKKSDVLKKGRKREFTDIRKMIAYLAKNQVPSITLAEISVYLGLKNHATALYSINTALTLKDQDCDIKRTLEHCEKLDFVQGVLVSNGFEEMECDYYHNKPCGILILLNAEKNLAVKMSGYSFHNIQNIDIFDAIIIAKNINSNPLGVLINSLKN